MRVFVGYDPREDDAYRVCRYSLARHYEGKDALYIQALRQRALRALGVYWRADDPLASTEFTYTRFLVPHLAQEGWALFMDCDMLVRANISQIMKHADPKYAVMVVKHNHQPTETTKMDGAKQTQYPRKNWSSLVLWNCDHPHVRKIDWRNAANMKSGAHLHQFQMFTDDEIGSLPLEWNWLEGWNTRKECAEPKIVHMTRGGPWFPEWQSVEFAGEWLKERDMMKLGVAA